MVFGPSVPRHALPAVHSMAAHAVPLARVSRIATRLKVFATLFTPVLPPLYRIRLLTALRRLLRACRRTTCPGTTLRALPQGAIRTSESAFRQDLECEGTNRPFKCHPGQGRGLSRSFAGFRLGGEWSRPCRSPARNLCNPPRRCRARRSCPCLRQRTPCRCLRRG